MVPAGMTGFDAWLRDQTRAADPEGTPYHAFLSSLVAGIAASVGLPDPEIRALGRVPWAYGLGDPMIAMTYAIGRDEDERHAVGKAVAHAFLLAALILSEPAESPAEIPAKMTALPADALADQSDELLTQLYILDAGFRYMEAYLAATEDGGAPAQPEALLADMAGDLGEMPPAVAEALRRIAPTLQPLGT